MRYLKAFAIFGILVFALFLNAQNTIYEDFLTTAVNVTAGATVQASSSSIWVSRPGYSGVVALICTFTRAAGSASTLDFYFQASHDGGETWENYDSITIEIPTNQAVYSGNIVREVYFVYVYGLTHLRMRQIINNDGANNVTAVNVTLSQGVN